MRKKFQELSEFILKNMRMSHIYQPVIPRRAGDIEDPRGGVRGVIPDNQNPVSVSRILKTNEL